MTLLLLFFKFFIIGLCAFGGGLATIPFLEELSVETGWFTIDELANMIAVSESTPGAIGINMSTYVGYTVAYKEYGNVFMGFLGGIFSTLGLVTPSIIVVIIVCQFLDKFKNAKGVKWTFYGLRAASIGLIGSAAYSILTLSICTPDKAKESLTGINSSNWYDCITNALVNFFDYKCLALGLFMGILVFKYKKHPLFYIALAALIGIIFRF